MDRRFSVPAQTWSFWSVFVDFGPKLVEVMPIWPTWAKTYRFRAKGQVGRPKTCNHTVAKSVATQLLSPMGKFKLCFPTALPLPTVLATSIPATPSTDRERQAAQGAGEGRTVRSVPLPSSAFPLSSLDMVATCLRCAHYATSIGVPRSSSCWPKLGRTRAKFCQFRGEFSRALSNISRNWSI